MYANWFLNVVLRRERETFRYVDLGALDNKAKRIAQANAWVTIGDASSRAKQVIAKGDVLFSTAVSIWRISRRFRQS